MKATIIEIYKDHCIAVTRDGRFLKERIPAGAHEIGDEIVISQSVLQKTEERSRVFQIISRTAIGFAVLAVIVFGSYFGIQYLRTDTPSAELAMAPEEGQEIRSVSVEDTALFPEEEGDSGGEAADTAAADEITGAEAAIEEAIEFEESVEAVETAFKSIEEVFSGTFSLEQLETEVMVENAAIFVSYRVDEMPVQEDVPSEEDRIKELTIKFKNMTENSLFDGNADILMLHSDMTVSEIKKILFENLDYNQLNTRKIPFSEETDFKLIVFGIFK